MSTSKRPSQKPSKKPWYRDGLRFECTGCGNCCTGAPGYVWLNKTEIEAIAALFQMDVDAFEKQYVRKVGIRKSLVEFPNGDCVFFDNEGRRCRIYTARPRQCRTWPFWDSNLRTAETWAEMSKSCPGANRGPLVALEEIREKIAVLKV